MFFQLSDARLFRVAALHTCERVRLRDVNDHSALVDKLIERLLGVLVEAQAWRRRNGKRGDTFVSREREDTLYLKKARNVMEHPDCVCR